ncbi:10036_t:CDS:2 [Gigaspora rosea]|nr:10036_t:CDS:2 [Gigaspora rosea]
MSTAKIGDYNSGWVSDSAVDFNSSGLVFQQWDCIKKLFKRRFHVLRCFGVLLGKEQLTQKWISMVSVLSWTFDGHNFEHKGL